MRRWSGLLAVLTLAALPAGAGVTGRVLDGQGAPVPGAAVTAFAPETGDQRAERLYLGRERTALGGARSGADGAFRIEGAPPVLDVQATADGYAPAFARAIPGTTTLLELRAAALRGGVITAGGKAVGGARVVWTGGADGSGDWSTRTAADGSYQVPDPETWSDRLFVFHPDFAPFDSADAREAHTALDQQLDTGVSLDGTVADETGRAVPDATLWVRNSIFWPLGRSGADGAFRVAHAPRAWGGLRASARSLTGSLPHQAGRLALVVRPARMLSGRVREGATGQPVAGASVSVYGGDGGFQVAFTDAAGGYRFEALPAGRYNMMVARHGYSAEVGPGQEGIDLRTAVEARHDVTLVKQPSVSGRVRDEAGRPVEGALVMLGIKSTPHIYAPAPFGAFGEEQGTRTESDGSFTLTLSDDSERMVDMLKSRPLVVLKRGYAAARADLKGATAAGSAPLLITLTRGIELAGRVRSADGRPLPGVAVTLAEDGTVFGSMIPSHFVIASLKGEGWVTTDSAGRFQVRVHPAVHHLAFRGAGLAPHLVRGYDPRSGQALDVVLEPAAVLRGRVVRPDGRAVPDVRITLSQPSGMNEQAATTGADGRFEVKDLARGLYELTAAHDTLGIHETRLVEVPAPGWQLVLEASGTLRGHVVDGATRQPVKAFHLAVTWAEEPGRNGGARQADFEDAAGGFELADVPARDLTVLATADGYAPRKIEGGVTVSAGAEGPEVEIALEADAPIRGRVTAEDKSGVPEATVRLATKGDSEGATSGVDEHGEYELRGVPPGEVTLAFQAQGFLTEKRTLDTRQTTRLDVTLRRGLSLSGVVASEGAPVDGAMVSASSSALNAEHAYVRTDVQGRFKIEGLVPGHYGLTASADGKGMARLDDVDPETAGVVRLVLERAAHATLTGKVIGLTAGDDLVYAEVKASNENGESGSATVDGAGTFRMEDAPAGHLTVVAEANTPLTTRQSRRAEVTVAAGAEAEIVLEFAATVVSGQVTREGRPVGGLTVSFDGPGLPSARGHTDPRGRYEVTGLEAGGYSVTVSGDGSSFETEYAVSSSGEFDIDITGGAILGKALRADGGAPVPGVEVALWPLGARENRPDRSATTNGQGEFALRSLREGRYRLTTSKEGFGQQVREVEVERAASASVLLELSPAAGVSVSVVDARDGRALAATVVVRDLGRHIVANSHSEADEEGALNIPLADGSYLLSTSASGYGTATVPVTAPSQGLRVGLTPGGTLVIESARDLRGRARLVQPDGEEYVQCWCNGIADIELTGRRTTVEHVTPSTYTLEVLEGDEVVARQPVVIREGQKTVAAVD